MEERLTPSFGRRKARKLKEKSENALREILPLLKLNPEGDFLKKRSSPLWLEIGFGGGEHFLEQLHKNPSVFMIGCEPFTNGIAKLLINLPLEEYQRVRIWPDDVRLLLKNLPENFIDRVFILFPDPWPKKRHHSRRLITRPFIDQLLKHLKEKALLYVASDHPSYVEQIQEVLYTYPSLFLREGPPSSDPQTWGERPFGWPPTHYEQKALNRGNKCAYMLFQKRESPCLKLQRKLK